MSTNPNTTKKNRNRSDQTRKPEDKPRDTCKRNHLKLSYYNNNVSDVEGELLKPLQQEYIQLIKNTNQKYYSLQFDCGSKEEIKQVTATSLKAVNEFLDGKASIINYKNSWTDEMKSSYEIILDTIVYNCCQSYKSNKKSKVKLPRKTSNRTKDSSNRFTMEEESEVFDIDSSVFSEYRNSLMTPVEPRTKKKKIDLGNAVTTITIIATAITNMVYNSLDEDPSIAVYFLSAVAILSMLCMCYFAMDAIVNENKMMIYSYILISLFLMGRLLYGLAFGGEAEELLTLVPSLLICFFEVLSVPVVKSFGWKLYRKIGSGKVLHELYNTYHIFVAILKIDFVFTLIVGLLGFFFVVFDYWWVYLLFATGILGSLMSSPLVIYFGIRRENKIVCSLFICICLLVPLFLIYKIIILWLPSSHEIVAEWGGSSMSQFEIKVGLTLLSSVAFIVKTILIGVTIVCMQNFGKGLAQTFQQPGHIGQTSMAQSSSTPYYSDTVSVTSNALFAVTSSGDIVINDDRKHTVSVSLTRSISDDSGFLGSSSHYSSGDEEEVTPINRSKLSKH